jgi:hypothetical protein
MFTLALESGAEKGSSLGGKPKEQEEVRKMGEVRVLKTTQLAPRKRLTMQLPSHMEHEALSLQTDEGSLHDVHEPRSISSAQRLY